MNRSICPRAIDNVPQAISAALIFYILAIAAVFVLRVKQPDAERPYKAFGYPIVPALYVIGASVIHGNKASPAWPISTAWSALMSVRSGMYPTRFPRCAT